MPRARHRPEGNELFCSSFCGINQGVMTPSMHLTIPHIEIDVGDREDGSELVEIEYQIDVARSREFESIMHVIRSLRLHDGAISWGLCHDVENPSRYVETFISESWMDHLRQH